MRALRGIPAVPDLRHFLLRDKYNISDTYIEVFLLCSLGADHASVAKREGGVTRCLPLPVVPLNWPMCCRTPFCGRCRQADPSMWILSLHALWIRALRVGYGHCALDCMAHVPWRPWRWGLLCGCGGQHAVWQEPPAVCSSEQQLQLSSGMAASVQPSAQWTDRRQQCSAGGEQSGEGGV